MQPWLHERKTGFKGRLIARVGVAVVEATSVLEALVMFVKGIA